MEFVCILDNVFFNKKILNYGDRIFLNEEESKKVDDKMFLPVGDVKKIEGKVKFSTRNKEEVVKSELKRKELENKIKKLEKRLTPRASNDI